MQFISPLIYYLKYTFLIITCGIASFLMIPVAIFKPKDKTNLIFFSKICQGASPILGIEWIIQQPERLSEDVSYVIMSNHQSSLDVLGMCHAWPILKNGTAVVREEVRKIGHIGLFLWLCGMLFISRTNGEKSKKILNKSLQTIKEEKKKVWIYPEGTRNDNGQILRFKKGGFHMALTAQIPILPVVFSRFYFLNHKQKYFQSGKVVMSVLPPISTQGRSLEDMDDVISETREKMISAFNKINHTLGVENKIE